MSRALRLAALTVVAASVAGAGGPAERGLLPPDALRAARWLAAPADGVALEIRQDGEALRLDFDFQGRGGWAAARLPLHVELPQNWALSFELRGEGPPNHLEVKLVDPSGENVWWSVRRDLSFPAAWTPLRVKRRQARFAWGPARGGELTNLGALELAVTAGSGGRGKLWLRRLALEALPPDSPYTGKPAATASDERPGHPAQAALDGDPTTSWQASADRARWLVDFGSRRELGGLTLHWLGGREPGAFTVELSDDGVRYRAARHVRRAGARRNDLRLPEEETRYVRLTLAPAAGEPPALAELQVQPLAFGESMAAVVADLARGAPRGDYPRGMSGEQVYWTVVGLDGGQSEILLSEDGAAEIGVGAPTLEPFLYLDGKLWSWADVSPAQALADADLPIPSVAWRAAGLELETTALAVPAGDGATLLLRYRLLNASGAPRRADLALAARPFQVNPPSQFLNHPGGMARLQHIACADAEWILDHRRVRLTPAPERCGAAAFDQGPITDWLRRGELPGESAVDDDLGHASSAAIWSLTLAPGESREVVAAVALDGAPVESADGARFAELWAQARRAWREKLDRVELRAPARRSDLLRTLRTGLAAILVHRDGPAIQPGSRAYARSWIRDGALTGAALLRLGHAAAARDFADWYAGYLYPDGKVPCCVDGRGADPVPENDSHGEWIHLVREVHRYTGDDAFARRHLASVERAVGYLDRLRSERRTAAYRTGAARLFYGLLPQSISHEGYSEKPMHSYWDDAFAYLGYEDAGALAEALGRGDLAARWRSSRDEFRADLLASMALARETHRIDYLPGCAELGDFDATSTTVLLEPAGLDEALPRGILEATFARYLREFAERRDGTRSWDAYTPYEWRAVGALVRLGWREQAHELVPFFMRGRLPEAWNLWPEVVLRAPRTPRFLGDLPHGWVASDFARSLLDLYAFERRSDGALVLAAGIPRAWLEDGEEVGVRALRTPWGELGYAMRLRDGGLDIEIAALERMPPGGLVLAPPLGPGAGPTTLDGAAIAGADLPVLRRLPARLRVERPW